MTVKVETRTRLVESESATGFEITDDGHLVLFDAEKEDTDVFASGEWLHAKVVKTPEGAESPREWRSLNDVPLSVRVRDSDGDVWDLQRVGFTDKNGIWQPVFPITQGDYSSWDSHGPFVEVVDG